ncbi:MAG: hypothetical protein KIS66_11535 [Fimbriimonadaceae bacterium]|nr:hypothetical protein [Fimbriimonadaceae bacterium]
MSRQDRFALRVGLRWLEAAFGLLALSVLVTAMFTAVTRLYEAGALSVPERRTAVPSDGRP